MKALSADIKAALDNKTFLRVGAFLIATQLSTEARQGLGKSVELFH